MNRVSIFKSVSFHIVQGQLLDYIWGSEGPHCDTFQTPSRNKTYILTPEMPQDTTRCCWPPWIMSSSPHEFYVTTESQWNVE